MTNDTTLQLLLFFKPILNLEKFIFIIKIWVFRSQADLFLGLLEDLSDAKWVANWAHKIFLTNNNTNIDNCLKIYFDLEDTLSITVEVEKVIFL